MDSLCQAFVRGVVQNISMKYNMPAANVADLNSIFEKCQEEAAHDLEKAHQKIDELSETFSKAVQDHEKAAQKTRCGLYDKLRKQREQACQLSDTLSKTVQDHKMHDKIRNIYELYEKLREVHNKAEQDRQNAEQDCEKARQEISELTDNLRKAQYEHQQTKAELAQCKTELSATRQGSTMSKHMLMNVSQLGRQLQTLLRQRSCRRRRDCDLQDAGPL